ncbi:MAG: SMP-30/gluconolactonase/LRE family protein [Phycisphaeraceae bacterium]
MRTLSLAFILLTLATPAVAESLLAPGATVVVLSDKFKFTEGPAVHPRTGDVYFTDIPNNRIHKWDAVTRLISVHIENTDGANGLYFDKDGVLFACQGTAKKVVSYDASGKALVLAETYNRRPFNAPNDLWVHPKGGVYFTDPNYSGKPNTQDAEAVYYISLESITNIRITRAADGFKRPNGIIGTADGKTLYVSDRSANKTWRYDIADDRKLTNKKLFCDEGSDGMTLDEQGNVYLTPAAKAVHVYNPEGKLIEKIETPEPPANLTFGGKERKTLLITARKYLLSVEMAVKGG